MNTTRWLTPGSFVTVFLGRTRFIVTGALPAREIKGYTVFVIPIVGFI